MIQKEFRIYGISLLVMIILYIIIQSTVVRYSWFHVLCMNMFCCLGCYILSFVSTHWVIKQYEKQQNKYKLNMALIGNRLSLEEILSTKDGFDLFANHLVKEFSIENLFFIFEMVQIKHELVVNQLIEEKDVGVMIPINFHRVNTLRKKDNYIYTEHEMKKSIDYIMNQYIDRRAEYCINISSYTRNTLQQAYMRLDDDMNKSAELEMIEIDHTKTEKSGNTDMVKTDMVKQYISIFDKPMEEIISLMKHDCLKRFYSSKAYKTLTNNEK